MTVTAHELQCRSDFVKLSIGQSISAVGSQVTLLALPLAAGYLAIPLAGALPAIALALLLPAATLAGLGGTVYNVSLMSLRQATAPDRLLGRVNGTVQFLVWGTMPLGSLLSGALGSLIGTHGTVSIAALGVQAAAIWIWRSPITSGGAPATGTAHARL